MENIIFSENKAVLKINEKIYRKEIIEKAAKDFSSLCSTSVNGNVIEITPLSANTDARTLSYEFLNYMLALIKEG